MTLDSKDFQDRNVVVTGGGGALGVAVCEALAARGARLHVPAFDDEDRERLAPLIDAGARVETAVDLSEEAAVDQFYDGVEGSLWASVHIAGGFVFGPLAEASVADLERMVSMNLRTAWLCCRAAVRRMSDGGRIVNVTAKPALVPSAKVVTYAATKAAVAALTTGLAEEVADAGIWVNAVAPSIMDTPANRSAMPDADHDAWPTVADVAATVAFLASPTNAVSRGAIVPVYGRS